MTDKRSLRYVGWLARDYFLWAGVGTIVIMVFIGAFLTEGLRYVAANGPHPTVGLNARQLKSIEANLLGLLSIVGPIVATLGIVSTDRRMGYFRLLFSRPVSGSRYYIATFIVNGLGFMVVSAVLWAVFSVMVVPAPSLRFLPMMGLSYLVVGGVVFFWSTIWRYDLLVALATLLAAATAWDVLSSDGPKGWLGHVRPLVALLPPVHRLSALVASVVSDAAITWAWVWWTLGYGVAVVVLALAILRRRQFGGFQ